MICTFCIDSPYDAMMVDVSQGFCAVKLEARTPTFSANPRVTCTLHSLTTYVLVNDHHVRTTPPSTHSAATPETQKNSSELVTCVCGSAHDVDGRPSPGASQVHRVCAGHVRRGCSAATAERSSCASRESCRIHRGRNV